MRRLARPSSAGTRVTAQSAATATVIVAARPSLPMNVMPDAYSPSTAMITVAAAIRTDRPLLATVRPAASAGSAPSMTSCRCLVVRNSA